MPYARRACLRTRGGAFSSDARLQNCLAWQSCVRSVNQYTAHDAVSTPRVLAHARRDICPAMHRCTIFQHASHACVPRITTLHMMPYPRRACLRTRGGTFFQRCIAVQLSNMQIMRAFRDSHDAVCTRRVLAHARRDIFPAVCICKMIQHANHACIP